MSAVLALAGSRWRRSWRVLVAIGVLVGLAGGFALGTFALGQRTTSAPDRLVAATGQDDARVALYDGSELAGPLAALPSVEAAWRAENAVGQLTGPGPLRFASISSGPPRPTGLFTPVAIRGTLPDPADPMQVAVTQDFAEGSGIGAGDVLELAMLTRDEVFQFDTGFGAPDGPTLALRVTAELRLPDRGGNGFGPVFGGPAFHDAYRDLSPGATVLLRLREGQRAAFEQQFADLTRDLGPAGELGPVQARFPADDLGPRVTTAQGVLGGSLAIIAGLAAVAGLLGGLQALARLAAGGAEAQRTEAALGLTPAQRTLARVLPAAVSAATAAALSVGGVLVAGLVEPLGGLRRYEPDPGWSPDTAVAVVGGLAVFGAVLLLTAATAWAAGRPPSSSGPRGRGVSLPGLLRGHPVVAAGAGLALARSGRGRSPARLTVTTTALGVAGVMATAVFVTSLDQLETSPERYGWQADFAIADIKEPQLVALAADPEVGDLQLASEAAVRLDGHVVDAQAAVARKGALPTTVLAGRLPTADPEVALGPRLADRLGLEIGDTVTLGEGDERRVVGIALGTPLATDTAGESALLTSRGLERAALSPPLLEALVRAADPSRADALAARYAETTEVMLPEQPAVVRNLLDLSDVPLVLGGLLVLLAGGALAHVLLQTTRRRGRDLAVLRALGLTPRQTGASLLAMATTTTLLGLAAGLPLGLLAGRLVWLEAASETGALHDVRLPWLLLVVTVPAALALSALAALGPARRAARLSPAALLQAD